MKTSRFAPQTPLERLQQSKVEKLKQEKDRASRLLVRLQWKAELLMLSYFKALEMLQACDSHEESKNALARRAESMFKIDFFEFYTFLERYITACLATLGVSVSASAPRENFNALRYITNPDLQRTRPLASHAFHANLLEALDDVKCPLHDSLGAQGVRMQLGLAKDYRNAWKDADEKIKPGNAERDHNGSSKNVKLSDLGLEMMLRTLVTGCSRANDTVQAYEGAAVNGNGLSSRDFEPPAYIDDGMIMDDVPLEYMDDAMELD